MSILNNAVELIWDDLLGRKGIGNELESYDEDIQQEIKGMIKRYIESALMEVLGEQSTEGN